jgi:hypothetical protein
MSVNLLLLSSNLSCTSPDLFHSPSLDEGHLTASHRSEFLFLVGATTLFPQTAPIVDDIFEPVTWRHRRRPFIRALTCKTTKTRRGVAGGASSDDQVSPTFM